MHMKEVKSSQLHSVGFDPETGTMAITFRGKDGPGSTYHYANCTQAMHDECMQAESVGNWFGKTLKPNAEKFPFTKQVPEEKAK